MDPLPQNAVEKAYSFIVNEEDARVCKDISDDACKFVPANFFILIISNTLSKLGDSLSNPKTVLAWLMSYVNAPLYLISLMVPIRESGSMLPQIFIASFVRKKPIRKWIWCSGSVLQFIAILGIGFVALTDTGTTAGWLITIFLILFSLSRGLSSVASKDVIGKTIPKRKRGRLNGYSSSISGFITLIVGFYIIIKSKENLGIDFYAYLIFGSAALWLLASIVYSFVKEYPGETDGGGNAFKEAVSRLELLKNDIPFRNFVIARALLLCSALTAPFYVVIAQSYLGKDFYILGLFIIASGIASSISAPIWGRYADISSKNVMVIAALVTSILGIIMFLIILFIPGLREKLWLYPLAFFILGIAHSGVRLGRKTYIIDMAGGNRRTDYVAVSNTIIGFILLLTGGISAAASLISPEGVILLLSLFGLAGTLVSYKLPDV